MVVDFVIPSSKDDLLSGTGSEAYCVEEVLTLRQIAPALQAFKSACRGNADCISLHFDSVFSVLCVQKNLDNALKEETWHCLLRGCQTYLVRLTAILDQSDLPRDDRLSHLKSTKMAIYLLCQFLELFDEGATKPAAVFTAKGRGKKQKVASDSGLNMDWDFEKHEGVKMLLNFVQLSLTKLWDPPVAEEEFVSLITSCCYKLLENPTTCKNKETLTTIAHIIGHMVKRYNHGLGASLKIDQLLKHFEFLTTPIVHIVEIIVQHHGCKSLLTDIIREIGKLDSIEAARDAAVGKAYASFLVEIAEKLPKMLMPSISLVVGHLEGESYSVRNGILGMMGEILIQYICKEELDDKLRATRDNLFDKLEDHVQDVHAFVRSKVLQIWLNIVNEKCLPLPRRDTVMKLAVGRLLDKSSNVRKNALQLVTGLLKSDPFAAKLPVEDLRSNYEKEKADLEEMTPASSAPSALTPEQEWVNQEWTLIQPSVDAAWESWTSREDEDMPAAIGDEETVEQVFAKIMVHLDKEEYQEALALTSAAVECFPDNPLFVTLRNGGNKSDAENLEDTEVEGRESTTNVKDALKEIFLSAPADTTSNELDEQLHALIGKQQSLVQYLQHCLTFAMQVQESIPIICQLLGSKNTTDVLEAVNFFVTAVEFGVYAATVGVRRMLVLVRSQETSVRDAVVAAYRQLYLQHKDKNSISTAAAVVKNLSALLVGCTSEDITSLEALVCEFVKSKYIGPRVIQALWKTFTLKSNAVTPQHARAAIMLLSMCAQAKPSIVRSKIDVLVRDGLGERAETDYLLAKGTCQALLKLVSTSTVKGKPPPEPFRLSPDHELFERLKVILIKGLNDGTNPLWVPLADLIVTVVYHLAEQPGQICEDLLRELVNVQASVCGMVASGGDGGEGTVSSSLSSVLARVLSVAGQVAYRQVVYLEEDVIKEIKRRQTVTEEKGKSGANNSSRRKSKGGAGQAGIRTESEIEEEMALAGGSVDDAEAEFVKKICVDEILNGKGMLSEFHPLLVAVCTNSVKFSDPELQAAASMALARFMFVSSNFCESQLQLLFTLLEKAQSNVIRSNLVIALRGLTFRFPNLVESWTSHIYARLRDHSPLVRKTTLQVLTHLILNDKVKGQISELATCIVDDDERIAGLAKLFFQELAKKSNSMYNIPDIVSRLSDPDIGVEESHFNTIIQTDRQVRDLSFCFSQLTYSENSKGIAEELEIKLEQAHNKGLEEGQVAANAAISAGKGRGKAARGKTPRIKLNKDDEDAENKEHDAEMESPLKPKRVGRKRVKTGKMRFTLDSDEDDDDLFDLGKKRAN